MLKVEHLQKRYDHFSLDCSMEVKTGMITGLIGRNGAGKTTLFKSVMGLISTDGGMMQVFGNEAGKNMKKEDRSKIAVAYADSGFCPTLMIKDCVSIMEAVYPSFDGQWFLDRCRQMNLALDKPLKDFSTGMRAKVKVLTALATNAKLLILDEPTVGLDVVARENILDMIRDYMTNHEESAVLISSHIASDIETLCDDIYMIDEGRIIFHEETDELLANYGIIKVSEEDMRSLDQKYILKIKKEPYGYCCLTNEKQFYLDNYPKLVVENGGIDELVILLNGGN